ncbi:MAG: hypothetical protein H6617_08705 [Bdellovibrionaceae bacterium]|nr:hypothetical protein [Bdellovibrionales bacterium]MCB9254746.1 hypothetical protein [Pseudobdellovibrionaceae bacterium]
MAKRTKKTESKDAAKPKAAPKKASPKKKTGEKKRKFCLQSHCRAEPVSEGYCRLHYISVWKTLQLNKRIKAEKKLNTYVDKLVKKYPKDYMERLKEGLENDDKFKETLDEIKEIDFDSDSKEGTDNEFLEKLVRDLKITD